jgi:CheY-like chemotaxis protein
MPRRPSVRGGCLAAFDDPVEAILAAIELASDLAAGDWGEVGRLRVRAALDTGSVQRRGARFFGPPLFRAARILGLAHGGETLISDTVLSGASGRLPEDLRLGRTGSAISPSRCRSAGCPFNPRFAARLGAADPRREITRRRGATDDGPISDVGRRSPRGRRGLKGFSSCCATSRSSARRRMAKGQSRWPRLQPDVILMDLMMPKMDSITAIGEIKRAPAEIVAVTSFIEGRR